MMPLDLLLASGGDIATEVLEGTASSMAVQELVRLSLAPAFLLVAIGGIMNVMMARLTWVAGRLERLAEPAQGACNVSHHKEVQWLRARRRLARLAIKFSTGAAVTVSVVIAVLFVSTFVEAQIGTFVVILWVLTIGLLITGLAFFLRETLLAAEDQGEKG